MRSALDIDVRRDDGMITVSVAGELDTATGGRMRSALERSLNKRGVDRIVLDLRRLRFCDSAGLAVVLTSHRLAAERAVDFRILRPRDSVASSVFVLSGFASKLPFDPPFTPCEAHAS
jgi:anti-sigma B factor antagonist